jgi:maltooligosyltrehalose trehalohydrolase
VLEISKRQLPVGAEIAAEGGVHFRVWAPARKQVRIIMESGPGAPSSVDLQREPGEDGYWSILSAAASAGTLYRFQLDDDSYLYPDPASRFQPDGPHGPSQVVDPRSFQWTDHGWRGVPREGQIVYEMHIGTFTREGTWEAAAGELPELARAGITVLELMPVAAFPGRFGWGYDGVNLFAPTELYGQPDDMRKFVNEAHAQGIGVILDVVYNHLGPDGNYLSSFSPWYFRPK